jgi:CO/xanthine dehydrogenase Mo-binding subunit
MLNVAKDDAGFASEGGVSRRTFLKVSAAAGGGMLIGFYLPAVRAAPATASNAGAFAPNAFVRIGRDETVTLIMPQVEMGQGTYTSMPMLIADELEVDLGQIELEAAPPDDRLYANPLLGFQATGGSTSVRAMWEPLRRAGAVARVMLISAAAQGWNVDPTSCHAEKGEVIHGPTGRKLSYGALADTAAALPVPDSVALKDAKAFKLIGTPAKRLDTPDKVNGKALVDYVRQEPPGLTTGWWRGVGPTHNIFMVESFIDELAATTKKDPVEYRRALLAKSPRARAVLDLAAEKAGWGQSLPPGVGRGVSLQYAFGTYLSQVAEVAVSKDGEVLIQRVVCAVDCGIIVNPDTVKAQIEGGIIFGLTAALFGEITLKNGRVEQSNFNDYRALRINEAPTIEVHLVISAEAPGGIGEPGTVGIAPAVANAIFAATGKRIRKLPVKDQLRSA